MSRHRQLLLGCALAAAGLLAYGNSLSGPFLFDDQVAILGNASIRRLASAWRPPGGQGVTVEGRPVLNLSFALNYALGGIRPWGYHAFNLAVHVLAGLALFGILRRTLPNGRAGSPTPPGTSLRPDPSAQPGGVGDPALPFDGMAFAIALLWLVHPLQTESVTYISQRAESLMGLFYLLTLYCFIRYAEGGLPAFGGRAGAPAPPGTSLRPDSKAQPGGDGVPALPSHERTPPWAALSVLFCLLGMGTKEVMVSAPLMVLLYDRTFLGGSFRAAWEKRRGLHLALASTWLLLAVLVAANGGNRGGSVGFGTGVSWTAYALTQFSALVRYLRLGFWPHPLVFDYGTFWVARPETVLPEALVVLGLLAGTLWALRRRPALGFLGMGFFAVLAPTSLLPGTRQMIVEHRMYLPLAAVLTAIVFSARAAAGRRRALFCAAAAVLAVAAIAATRQRNADYGSAVGLWADTVARRPGNAAARNNLGSALKLAGRLPEAAAQYEAGLRLEPGSAELHNNLGGALHQMGRIPEAMAELQAALRIAPDFPEAHNNLGSAWEEVGQPARAAPEFAAALRLRPGYAEAHNNLGLVLQELGRAPEATAEYEAALRLRPDYVEARNNLGNALVLTGRVGEAIAAYREALRLRPDYVAAANNLGNALDQAGRVGEAIAAYQAALRFAPGDAGIRYNLNLELQRAQGAGSSAALTGNPGPESSETSSAAK